MHSLFAENHQITEVEIGWAGSSTGWFTITIREYLFFAQARILNRELKRAMFLRHGREHFACLGSGLSKILKLIVSNEKKFININVEV